MTTRKTVLIAASAFVLLLLVAEFVPFASVGFWRLAFTSELALTGGGGRMPIGEVQYRKIMASPFPEFSLRALYAVGNAQAKAYSIWGFHELASPRFDSAIREYEAMDGTVMWRVGDTCQGVSHREIADIIRELIQRRGEERQPNQALQPTSITLSVYEKSPVSGRLLRGG